MIFMQNEGSEGPCADYYQVKQQHNNLRTTYLLDLWSRWVKFLVSSPAKTHQFKKGRNNRTGHLKTCQDCVHFQNN